jgi:hypothetical protein
MVKYWSETVLETKAVSGSLILIMHSGITEICYRKTLGHVFTKPVQIEGKAQTFFPVSCFS